MVFNIGLDRLIDVIDGRIRDAQAENELKKLRVKLLREFKDGAEQDFKYLTMSRLCWSIGLDPTQEGNRSVTAKLLTTLPRPGPSHADTKHHDPPKPPEQQLWRNPYRRPNA